MSDVIVLGDCHIGARNANVTVMEHQIRFFENQLFPYMKEKGINTIIQTGDLMDSRKFSNHVVLDVWRSRMFDYMRDNDIEFHMVLGNHDIATKNSLWPNSPTLFLSDYENVYVHDTPWVYKQDGFSMLLVPWICPDDNVIMQAVKDTKATLCLGHFEFAGFEMNKGYTVEEGLDSSLFKKFEMVISGHYHTRSSKKNVTYVGTPYELTWIDSGDQKGFHVLYTNDSTLKFIKTKDTLFKKIEYVDGMSVPVDVADSYVKVVVSERPDPNKFDSFMNKLYLESTIDVKVVDDVTYELQEDEDEDVDVTDTKELLSNYVKSLDIDLDKEKLIQKMNQLYVESLEVLA